jgi:hypothetical protein
MSALTIEIAEGRSAFAPGDKLAGTLRWQLPAQPKGLELRLFWYTEGKGTRDSAVVDLLRVDAPAATGNQRFEFVLPDGPFSFSGKLISLIWAVELVALPSQEVERLPLVVAPMGQEIDLGAAAAEARP